MWWGIAYCDKEKTLDFTVRTLSEGELNWTVRLDRGSESPLSYAKHSKMYDQVYSLNEGDFLSTLEVLRFHDVEIPTGVLRFCTT